MNILNYYRKFIKKSRSFFTGNKRVDIFLFVAAVAVLVFIAVHQLGNSAKRPKRMDISISPHYYALLGGDTFNALIQEFEEQHPDLRIQIATQEGPAVIDGADVIFFDEGEFNSLLNEDTLASLAPYIHPETQAGHWALPLVSFMDIFVYNIDLLEAANLDRPPKTRAEFLSAARAVTDSEESVFAFALGLSPSDPMALRRDFYPWLWINGGDIAVIDSLPREFLDTIAFFEQLNREKLLAPGTFEKTGAQRLEEFAEGKIAMILASARDIVFLKNNADDITFGITTLPATTLGEIRLGLSGIYAGINSECTLPDEAWSFLAFIAGKKHILAEALGAVPGSYPGTFPGEYIVNDPLYSKAWAIFEAADTVEYHPGFENEDEINNLIRVKLAEALLTKEE